MPHILISLVLFTTTLWFPPRSLANTKNTVNIAIQVTALNEWIVTYQTDEPTKRIVFYRQSDATRSQRWQPTTTDFKIGFDFDEQHGIHREYVQRVDEKPFTTASFQLTPTYKHIPKEYAPFSPFSDGGTLIYTGRLMACANSCENTEESWPMQLSVPSDLHIIVNGERHRAMARWTDADDGKNVYVGTQIPIESDGVISLVDPGLPQSIKDKLQTEIPKLTAYFAHHLGAVSGDKMTLFASYANIPGHSSQGGTLPNQIFMHWNMNDLSEKASQTHFLENLLWFFAHEVAHFFQRDVQLNTFGDAHESWIHEGHAEYAAAVALKTLYPGSTEYVNNRIQSQKASCLQGLNQTALNEAAKLGNFNLYYSCGLWIYEYLDRVCFNSKQQPETLRLWRQYRDRRATQTPESASESLYYAVATQCSQERANTLKQAITTQPAEPGARLAELIESSE